MHVLRHPGASLARVGQVVEVLVANDELHVRASKGGEDGRVDVVKLHPVDAQCLEETGHLSAYSATPAREVHMRIASSPIIYSCLYGIDTPN